MTARKAGSPRKAGDLQALVDAVGQVCADRPDLLRPEYAAKVARGAHPLTGHCYVATEALSDPGAKRKADREGRPAKIAITGTPGGARSLRVTPGWLDDAPRGALPAEDCATPPAPLHVPGVTVGQLSARWVDREEGAGAVEVPALPVEDAAFLDDLLAVL